MSRRAGDCADPLEGTPTASLSRSASGTDDSWPAITHTGSRARSTSTSSASSVTTTVSSYALRSGGAIAGISSGVLWTWTTAVPYAAKAAG
ncbi:hypothetical protein M2155_004233 [Streptomyces sp. SAI-119]|uniref:hypothetical protein n=1 Tax=Streptomyces sp. SAI-119 TaxID=2940541 RepID=UPI0024733560|nr:hypothetical protein [Streptomyces sp. SAI-119]MDH6451825.1 hypothetical protein [Streptomyces sp. SAI-119]